MQKDFIYENYLKMPDDLEFEQAMKVMKNCQKRILKKMRSMTSYGIMHFIV